MNTRIIVILMLFLITSCQHASNTDTDLLQTAEKVEAAIETSLQMLPKPTKNIVEESATAYLGTRRPVPVIQPSLATLPGLERRVDIKFAEPVNLATLVRILSLQSGVTIQVDPELSSIQLTHLDLSGTVQTALDSITSQLSLFWRIRRNRVEIYHTMLRSWVIYAPSVSSKWQATVGLSGTVSAGTGGSDLQANDQVVISMDTGAFWDQLEASITGYLSPFGRLTLNRQSGELSVVDTPSVLEILDHWVTAKNQEFATQVLVNVELYEVERSAEEIWGYNVEGFLRQVFGDKSASVEFNSDDTGALLGLRFNQSDAEITKASDLAVILRNAMDGAQVSKLTSTILRTMNSQPVPVFFGDETSYLQRRDVVTNDGVTTIRLVPGKLQDGIALNLVPRVLPDTDRMLLNITVRTTRIKNISRFPADAGPTDPVIQLPDLESRSMLLPALLRSGETLFVAGLDTARSTQRDAKGILSNEERSENRRSSLVLLITPHIIPTPLEISGAAYLGEY